jgi:hypothetical protein
MVSPFLALILEHGVDQFLLAQAVGALDRQFGGHVEQFADV